MGGEWTNVDPNYYCAKPQIKEQLFGEEFHERLNKQITVKIYMSNVQPNQAWAQIGHALTRSFPFGNCHAGIQVGNKTVNWYDNSLVTIGDFAASTGFILFSPKESLIVTLTEELMEDIADFIVRWNCEHNYNVLNKNCHVFVEEVLKVFGLPMPSGPLRKFIDRIRNGETKRRIQTQNCGVLEFETHEELDHLEMENSESLTVGEKKILKLFHRGFQMQERAKEIPSVKYCPAGQDPTVDGANTIPTRKEEDCIY
eukprot:TRINITY_DN13677_c0_g1_i1.p1 TRINITY_DN13677_c0_g1~~TRINITY_DN13677_c0_g1_i1.p1  ORF type:complete len:291 (-),score=29.25 TRINITY_DN13677_c0_g1_i1:108-875(-)